MQVGVIGVGRLGSLFARALVEHPDVDGLVLAGSRPGRADRLAAELDATPADTADQVYEAVDAVVIAASTSAHRQLVVDAAAAGLPAFCEKPLALDLNSTDEMVRAVEAAGTELQVGFQRRFDPGYRRAHEMVASGALGEIYVVRATSHDPEPSRPEFIETSGDLFLDLVIHDFDAVRYVTGQEITAVSATAHAQFEAFAPYRAHRDFGVSTGTLDLSGGALAAFTATRHNPAGYDIRMEIFGSKGSIAVGLDRRTPISSVEPGMKSPTEPPYRNFLDRFEDAYKAEMFAFVEMALGRAPNPCAPSEARAAFVASLAASRSAREGRTVELSEVG